LGAAVACPNRKTIVFEGDGSGMYTPQTLWTMAREKANITVVVMKNDNYGILNIELARVREGEPNEKMLSMMHLDNPSLDWVKLAEGQGVPATRATTAEEFHKQFEAAMNTKGPRLIEAQIVQNLKPAIDAVHSSRG
jgi:acetolactate synthase-1/2/3 large subunit